MKVQNMAQNKGFTIVELLIVIVVIGVLSSLTLTAFNGVQQRSVNASLLATYRESQKMLTSYSQVSGYLNLSASTTTSPCIGEYDDVNGDGYGDCLFRNGSPHTGERVDNVANSQLKTLVAKIPGKHDPITYRIGSNTWTSLGPTLVYYSTGDPGPNPPFTTRIDTPSGPVIQYILGDVIKGTDQSCGYQSITYDETSSTPSVDVYQYANNDGTTGTGAEAVTFCSYPVFRP